MRSLVLRSCLVASLVLFASGGAWAQSAPVQAEIKTEKTTGYGRLVFTFPEPVTAEAKVAGGVMIVTFDRKVALGAERLPVLLPGYITAARLDPDQRSLRLALNQSVRADLKDAAEALYLDLMPTRWRGPPPPLPADVADRLAKRLRERRGPEQVVVQAKAPPAQILAVAARAVGRVRVTVPLPPGVTASADIAASSVTIRLGGDALFDQVKARAGLAQLVSGVDFPAQTILRFDVPQGAKAQAMQEEGGFAIELVTPEAPVPVPLPAPPPTRPQAAVEPAPQPAAQTSATSEKVLADIKIIKQDQHVALKVSPKVAAAVFERDGALQLVLSGTRAVLSPKIDAAAKAAGVIAIAAEQHDGWSHLALRLDAPLVPNVIEDADGWTVLLAREPAGGTQPIKVQRAAGQSGQSQLSVPLPQPGEPVWLDLADSNDRLIVVPMRGAPHAALAPQIFTELTLLRSALGLVVEPRADDLVIKSNLEAVIIDRPGGLTLSARAEGQAEAVQKGPVFDADAWAQDRRGSIRETERALLFAAADAPKRERTAARMRLASFYLANNLGQDARAVLTVALQDDPKAANSRHALLMRAYAETLSGNETGAAEILSEAAIGLDPEAVVLRATVKARMGQAAAALEGARAQQSALERLPEAFQAHVLPTLIEAALAQGDTFLAGHMISALEQLDVTDREAGAIQLYNARLAEAGGRKEEAMAAYADAARVGPRPVEAEARLGRALLGLTSGLLPADTARAELETVVMIWRRGPVEVRASARLAQMAAAEGRWRDAFTASRRAIEVMPDHPVTRALQDEMERRFENLFLGGESTRLSKIETLAIFDEFRSLVPPGPKGDVIVRHLADRLTDLDLVPQAIDLLKYQVTHRLKGAPRAEAAARLALLQLSEGMPQDTLATLRASRLSGLTPELRQQRLYLEARALSELSRTELALEIIAPEQGREADRLRADILWRAKRWGEAAETYERSLGERWQAAEPLDSIERTDALRAAIGYVLASDKIGTDRLRSKFLAKMAPSPDGELFRLTTIDYLSRPDAFQAAARRAVGARALSDFLPAYKKRFTSG